MSLRRSLLVAALVGVSATPAAVAATQAPSQSLVYTVSASAANGTSRVEATCVYVPDYLTADYGATTIHGFVVTNGAIGTTVRCELLSDDTSIGDVEGSNTGPVGHVAGSGGFIGERTRNLFCVTAEAQYGIVGSVGTGRVCTGR